MTEAVAGRTVEAPSADPLIEIENLVFRRGDRLIFDGLNMVVPSGKITDQKRAGTCWLFAALNWLRTFAQKKMKVKGFEFSANYVVFWDKFEKANHFLENMIEMRDRPLDDRYVNHFLANTLQRVLSK